MTGPHSYTIAALADAGKTIIADEGKILKSCLVSYPMPYGDATLGMQTFALMTFGMTIIAFLVIHLLYAIILFKLSSKLTIKHSWLALIPGGNIYVTVQAAGLPAWYTLLMLLAFLPQLGSILFYAGFIYLWWKILERLGYERSLALLWLFAPAGIVLGFVVAFSRPRKKRRH